VDYSDSTPDVSYTIDRQGRQIAAGSSVSAHTFAYNALQQLESETITTAGATNLLSRTYDSLGRPAAIALDSDYSVSYAYDDFGRMNAVAYNMNGQTGQVTYPYLAGSDLLAGYAASGGTGAVLSVTRTYEPARNLLAEIRNEMGTNVISCFAYTNDAAGRRVGRVDFGLAFGVSDPMTNIFGYNARSELTSALISTGTYTYAYDPIGNRTAATNNGEAWQYQANALNQYTQILHSAHLTTDIGESQRID